MMAICIQFSWWHIHWKKSTTGFCLLNLYEINTYHFPVHKIKFSTFVHFSLFNVSCELLRAMVRDIPELYLLLKIEKLLICKIMKWYFNQYVQTLFLHNDPEATELWPLWKIEKYLQVFKMVFQLPSAIDHCDL